jgi:hypothetical protein
MAQRTEIAAEIESLAVHCRPPIMEVEQRASWTRDWCNDLGEFPIEAIRSACRQWRQGGQSKFPTPGQLLPLIRAASPQATGPKLEAWAPADEETYRAMTLREKIRERQILAQEAYRKAGPMFRNAAAGGVMTKARGEHLKPEQMSDAWRHWTRIGDNHKAEAVRLREKLHSARDMAAE